MHTRAQSTCMCSLLPFCVPSLHKLPLPNLHSVLSAADVTVYFDPSVYNATEGQKVLVTLVTDRLVEQPIMVTVETRGGSATG